MKTGFGLLALLVMTAAISGCGEDAEKEAFRQELIEKALNDEVRKAGDAFMADNAKAEGVVTTPSGLQYKVLASGDGDSPAVSDQVTVHYEGMRTDGHVFDSSYKRGKPTTFPLNRVIKGWTEGVSMMKRGDVWMLYIPPELAYGATSPSEDIPANSTLIFKVELIDFTAAE
ncbi:FKBP-type peptidyl-prolyl cis-trans isomerase [Neptuniibacter halophilus]|uniref:FKBP-type peptidyl-prolyl cis-trans isomerase n=1 Tax=Neptuniibacter halophilus TaxID=651666 RepID=UPI002573E3E2|nr:FKBP-type peptidyl-prolyl cis-trans isomerase [Neptuniibacter halophilus]